MTRTHACLYSAGKVGAVVGTFIYEPIAETYGIPAVMWLQVPTLVLYINMSCTANTLPRNLHWYSVLWFVY
jgi:hypothetical protein